MVARGENPVKKVKREDRKSLPSCTGEGMNYILECVTCRNQERRRAYLGEKSRSTYQRGREHAKEIREGTVTHPMVIHCIEEHGGDVQPILMRTLLTHLTAMDRQVQESLNILEEARRDGQCLNLKSEWAGAEIPGLQVNLPKGIAKDRGRAKMAQEDEGEDGKEGPVGWGGTKRMRMRQAELERLLLSPVGPEDRTEEGLESNREVKKPRTQEPQPAGKNQPKRPRNFLEVLMANRERKEIRKLL